MESKETKCYCGHTTYCDCGPAEPTQKTIEEFAISFHHWMMKNDTPENAERFFHYSDNDMMNVFKEENNL